MPQSSDILECKAFLLTGESQDYSGRNELHLFGRSPELGPLEIIIQNNKPVFFIEQNLSSLPFSIPCQRTQTQLKTFLGQPVDALYFQTQKDLIAARQELASRQMTTYEADIYPCDRFLMERFINCQITLAGTGKKEGSLTRFLNPRLRPAFLDPKFKMVSIDIETGVRSNSLYSIAVHLTGMAGASLAPALAGAGLMKNQPGKAGASLAPALAGAGLMKNQPGKEFDEKKVFMLDPSSSIDEDRLAAKNASRHDAVLFYPSEALLLKDFIQWFQQADPDLILGWNVVSFDLLFLQTKCRDLGILFEIGRNRRAAVIKKRQLGGHFAIVPGRVVLDGPVALRSSFYSFEDFSLETVSQEILGEGKLIQPGQNKIQAIEQMFREDKAALAHYNLHDAVLVTKIFEKTGLLQLYVKRAQISGLLLDQIGLSTAAFDHFYLPRLHRRGFVAPNISDVQLLEHAAGGYVIPPQTGLYDHVLVLDFKSLYPSIIRTFSIDPLSRLLATEDPEPVVTPQNFKFSRKEAILPEFIRELMELRSQAAAKNDGPLSQAIKILMNSFYGVMGSAGCRFYHSDLPTAITSTGQWLLLGSKDFLEAKGYEVLYGDTDSLFVRVQSPSSFLPRFKGEDEGGGVGHQLAAELSSYWQQKLKNDFNVTSYLEVKFEKFYRRFALPKGRAAEGAGAKKRYAGLRVQADKKNLEFVGMEFVRSDWTKLAKEFQEGLYQRIFENENPESWIKKFVQEVREGKVNLKLIYRKRLRKGIEDYTKSIPPHVKAALQLKKPGREIKYIITKTGPVPIELNPQNIDYNHYVEKQLKPIADSILPFIGLSFENISKPAQYSWNF